MTFTNLSISQIREFLRAGKPCYLETTAGRIRIFQIRVHRGQFQIKPISSDKWKNADHQKVICAY
jgi:hypothetical protein